MYVQVDCCGLANAIPLIVVVVLKDGIPLSVSALFVVTATTRIAEADFARRTIS